MLSIKKGPLLLVIFIIVLFHIIWYSTSRIVSSSDLPDNKKITEYHTDLFKRLKINADMNDVEEKYIEANGFNIHMDILNAGKGLPTIVFIPGTSAYAQLYIEFLDAMNKEGFNVIGFDPRGHGRSNGPRGDYTINELIDDTLAVVEYAKKRFGGKVAVSGSSQGGIAAFYAAARDNSIAASICHNIAVLNGKDNLALAPLPIPQWSIPFIEFFMTIYQSYAIPISIYLDLSKELLKDGTDAETLINIDPLCVTWISLRAFRSLLRTDLAVPVEKITVPIMVLHAGKDNIFPNEYIKGIYDRLTCKKKLLLIENAEHLIMTNNVPEIRKPISKWLKKVM